MTVHASAPGWQNNGVYTQYSSKIPFILDPLSVEVLYDRHRIHTQDVNDQLETLG
jgi:hypothetical protein